jgi:hypothetical protein
VAHALALAGLGWAVIPMHTIHGEGCSCGHPDCPSPGKHPRIRWQEFERTAPEPRDLTSWWQRWPDANIGVVTGSASGVVVIDVDPRNGGDAVLAALEAEWGALPDTSTTRTGGGGTHLWFAVAPGEDLPSAVLGRGLELKADGSVVVVPPSTHASGARYAWRTARAPWELEPAPLPDWLHALAGGGTGPARQVGDGAGPARHVGGETMPRAPSERIEFAEAWARAGIALEPGDHSYLCPFHDDHRPSLHIDAKGCRWFCFGCRRGGGIGRLRHLLGEDEPVHPRARLSGRRGADEPVTLEGDVEVEVVGESRHQQELLTLTGGSRRYGGVDVEAVASLVPDPGNRYDVAAVQVRIDGLPVGYLRHQDAVTYRSVIDERSRHDRPATCLAWVRGGWDRGRGDVGAFGVSLLLPATVR